MPIYLQTITFVIRAKTDDDVGWREIMIRIVTSHKIMKNVCFEFFKIDNQIGF